MIIGHWLLKAELEQALEKRGNTAIRQFIPERRNSSSGMIALLKKKVMLRRKSIV